MNQHELNGVYNLIRETVFDMKNKVSPDAYKRLDLMVDFLDSITACYSPDLLEECIKSIQERQKELIVPVIDK